MNEMVNQYFALMRNRYAKNRVFPVETYRDFEWDGKSFLLTYVTEFYDLWMDAYAYGGATHYAGISKLIHSLPTPWSEWADQAAVSYTWFSPPEYTPRGDLVGLMGVLLPAMSAAVDGPPLHPPVQKYSPGEARRMRYRNDKEPHVARVSGKQTLRMRVSAPLRIERGEGEGHESDMEDDDEDEDPEEDMNDID